MSTQQARSAPVATTTITTTSARQHAVVQALRLFVAVPLPAAVRTQVTAAQQSLAALNHDHDVRWVRAEQAHLTLHFLGDTPQGAVPDLTTRLSDALADTPALTVQTTGIGAFPHLRRPRVLWLGLDAADGLAHLAQAVQTACGATPSPTSFVPHITLGRVRQGRQLATAALTTAINAHAHAHAPTPVVWQADRVDLIRSVLGTTGPTYTGLHTWQLPTPDITDHG